MRVLLLAPQPFFEVRGTPLAVAALARTLGALGHAIDLLTFPQGEPWSAPRVRHLRSFKLTSGRVRPGFSVAKALQDLPFTLKARRLVRTGAYDVVHAVEEAALLIAPFVPQGVKFVVDMDSDLGEQLAHSKAALARVLAPWARSLHERSLRRADLVIVINERLAATARAAHPRVLVHRLEDPPLVSALTDEDRTAAAALRRELRLGDGPVSLYTGNFEPYQGVDLMARAAAAMGGGMFVFVGGEPEDIAAVKGSLTVEVLERVRFVGKQAPETLPRWMAMADVLVSPRILGGNTPFKIYTYLASGKPIVATRLDTHTQVLSDDNAFLVDPTPEALAGGIEAAIGNSAERARRALNGLALMEREYSNARYREKVAAAYAALAR
jgi:glycosyltransferase involved in cell wall biosynthesis